MTILLGPGVFHFIEVLELPVSGTEMKLSLMGRGTGVFKLNQNSDRVWFEKEYPYFTPTLIEQLPEDHPELIMGDTLNC